MEETNRTYRIRTEVGSDKNITVNLEQDYDVFEILSLELTQEDTYRLQSANYGVVVCTSGEGISMAANKVPGVRCGIAYNDDVARLMRQHNNANVISFGQKFMELEDVLRRVDIFLNTEFEGGRHQTRVEMIDKIK